MTTHERLQIRWSTGVIVAVALLAIGAAAGYWFMRPKSPGARPRAVSTSPPTSAPDIGEPRISLSPEAMTRAGVRTAAPTISREGTRTRVPAVVSSNAYRSVSVTPLLSGRVARVTAVAGQSVRSGQSLAEIYSPELADAQTRYVASRTDLEAHERELRRTEELAKIGAASQQELERLHAEHAAAVTMVQTNRSRLVLLGMSGEQADALPAQSRVNATATVTAPIDGVITERHANPGMNVEPSSSLFTVVDLSTVWIVGDVYERDLANMQVGTAATVTVTAFPEKSFEGKLTYIDPQVRDETRTAQVRVELPNPGRLLRPGMYAEVQIASTNNSRVLAIPHNAVQLIGGATVVYLADSKKSGDFIERQVHLGERQGDLVQILDGIEPSDLVVVEGSFALRAMFTTSSRSGIR